MTEQERNKWTNTRTDEILIHGPSKLLVDRFHWFYPQHGIVASYKVKPKDVLDHFGVFRGVDVIETAGQTGVAACTILECVKQEKTVEELKQDFRIAFLGMGKAIFHDFVKEGDYLFSFCKIKQYKYRQMTIDVAVYGIKEENALKDYFQNLQPKDFDINNVAGNFKLVATIDNLIGRAVKNSIIYKQTQ